jgi:hypothetical protein
MTWISAPICEGCWYQRNPEREPVRVAAGYRDAELCHVCRTITYAGVYVRAYRPDPNPDTWGQPTPDQL